MSLFKQSAKDLEPSFLKILDTANTACCALYWRAEEEKIHQTYHKPAMGNAQPDNPNDKKPLFQMASLVKVFIAACICLIIEKLSLDSDPENPFREFRGAWSKSFTEVFNKISKHDDYKMDHLPGDPSLLQMLVHYDSVYGMNHIFLAPDATPLQGFDEAADTISRYAQEIRKKEGGGISGTTYSNPNFVLLALLIDRASGSFNDFLKEHILGPFKMENTFLNLEDLVMHSTEDQRQPHVVSSDRSRQAFRPGEILGLANVVELALLGPYISTLDLARFFEGLQSVLEGGKVGSFDIKVVEHLSIGIGGEGKQTGYLPGGLRTTLSSTGPGQNSINRLMWSENDHVPGKSSEDEDILVLYLAGSATGWAHTVYFIPKRHVLVMVLTNSSGPVDASDVIAMLCLQDMFELRPPKIGSWKANLSQHTRNTTPSSEQYGTYYADYAAEIFRHISPKFKEFEDADAQPDTLTSTCPELVGTYLCSSGQYLEIMDKQVEGVREGVREGVLRVAFKWQTKSSKELRLALKGETFRICTTEDCPTFAIDRFTSWKNLEFEIQRDGKGVQSVSRQGVKLKDFFSKQ